MNIKDPKELQRMAREYCKDMAVELTLPAYHRLATQISRSITKNREVFDALSSTEKVVQVFVFIVFMMFRVGDSGNMFHWGTGFMNITDSPSTISPPQTTTTTTTTTTSTTTTTTTANQKNQFDHFLDPHSSAGRDDIDPYIDGSPSYVYDERPENDLVFGVMTSAGYFFITIVLMIGVIMGDNQSFTLFLFNFFGFLFFIAMGSEQIDAYKHAPSGVAKARAMGSMAILTSFVFLVDTVFNILAMWNSE